MTAPAVAGYRLAMACGLGLILGLIYGFLRPLRRRAVNLGDGLFLLCAAAAWLYLGFGICGGDLRLGYFAGLFIGGFFWELTVGRLLRPVFSGFWKGFFQIWDIPRQVTAIFLKKTRDFLKKIFASGKKSGTIKSNYSPHSGHHKGGRRHGKPVPSDSSGLQTQQQPDQDRPHERLSLIFAR